MGATKEIRPDKFTFSYVIWLGLYFLFFICGEDLDRILHLWILLVPILLLPGAALLIYFLVGLIKSLWNRHWRRMISLLIAPFIIYGFFIILKADGITKNQIRLELNKSSYLQEIDRLPSDKPKLKIFDWGSTGGVAVANTFYTLVYDESDNINQPASFCAQENVIKMKTGTQLYSICEPASPRHLIDVERIEQHFYLVTETYQ